MKTPKKSPPSLTDRLVDWVEPITLDDKIRALTKEVWRRLELKDRLVSEGKLSAEDAQRACDVFQAVLRDYLELADGRDNRERDRQIRDLR